MGENQVVRVSLTNSVSGLLLGLLWGWCLDSAFSQVPQLFGSYHPSSRMGNQCTRAVVLKVWPPGQQHGHHLVVRLCSPDLLSGFGSLCLTSPPGDSDAHWGELVG